MASENVEHRLLWQIENFSACTEPCIFSPVTRIRSLDDSACCMKLAPGCDANEEFISVHVIRSSDDWGPENLQIELELCLIDIDGEERFTECGSWDLERNQTASFLKFVRRSLVFEDRDNLLPNDVLTLLLRVTKSDPEEFIATRSVVHTKIQVERSNFLWTIRGLSRKVWANKRIIHIKSSAAINALELSCLTTYKRETEGNERVLLFAIRPKDVPKVRIFMSARIWSLDSRSNPTVNVVAEHFFEAQSFNAWYLPSLDISDRMDSLLASDQLRLTCHFSISDGSHDEHVETLTPLADKFNFEENTLPEDIESVYERTINTTHDVSLHASNGMQLLRAHKVILSARSLVFRQILNHFHAEKKRYFDLRDSGENIPKMQNAVRVRHENVEVCATKGRDHVRISHISHNILAQMIECMYTDALNPGSVSNAKLLYSAGVLFDFRLLHEKSENYLISKICLKSIYPILKFAHFNGVARLKCKCLNFISENRGIVLASNEWLTLRNRHRDLAQEISNILKSEESNSRC